MNPLEDGITHINIYSKGETEVGRMLSNFYHSPFIHPVYGKFASIEGFWYWLKTGKKIKTLKTLYGANAKKVGRQHEDVHIDRFDDHIKIALACKMAYNPDIVLKVCQSDLPFEHYYYYGERDNPKVYNLPQYKWLCDWFEEYRTEVKKGLTWENF